VDYHDLDPWELWEPSAEEAFDDALKDAIRDTTQFNLGTYGDAVEARVRTCLDDAAELSGTGRHDMSIVRSATASEIVVRYLIVEPLLAGMHLSDMLGKLLTGLSTMHRARNREIVPALLRHWDIDLGSYKLGGGAKLWDVLVSDLWPARDRVVHAAEAGDPDLAARGHEAATDLMDGVIVKLSEVIGLSWPDTAWHEVVQGVRGAEYSTTYEAKSPWETEAAD
jgi:hypothetical protein